jgi:hypothetical protein
MTPRPAPLRTILPGALLVAAIVTGGRPAAASLTPHPLPGVFRPAPPARRAASAVPPTWNYQFLSGGTYWFDTFIGRNPTRQLTTKIPVYLIPIKMVFGPISYSNLTLLPTGKSVLQTVLDSPVFKPAPFVLSAGQDPVKLQYLDAVQKVKVWNIGGAADSYHIMLDQPIVEPEQTITVHKSDGFFVSYFGGVNLIADNITGFDRQLLSYIKQLHIPSNALPVFLTTQTYLTYAHNIEACCYAYYRSLTPAGQPFVWASFIQNPEAWSQDVSGLSAALAGWANDPYDDNDTPCGGYEASAQLVVEGNWGAEPYRFDGFTYNLTDVAELPYFGDASGATLNNLVTFWGAQLAACQDGP